MKLSSKVSVVPWETCEIQKEFFNELTEELEHGDFFATRNRGRKFFKEGWVMTAVRSFLFASECVVLPFVGIQLRHHETPRDLFHVLFVISLFSGIPGSRLPV